MNQTIEALGKEKRMVVRVKRYNKNREVVGVDKYTVSKVRLQPAGLIELSGQFVEGGTKYIRFYPTDLLDVFIEEE